MKNVECPYCRKVKKSDEMITYITQYMCRDCLEKKLKRQDEEEERYQEQKRKREGN